MTTSNWRKALKQLKVKPTKMKKYIKHNAPKKRSVGRARISCGRCGQNYGHIGSYGLDLCRHCFRQTALKIGFRKYS